MNPIHLPARRGKRLPALIVLGAVPLVVAVALFGAGIARKALVHPSFAVTDAIAAQPSIITAPRIVGVAYDAAMERLLVVHGPPDSPGTDLALVDAHSGRVLRNWSWPGTRSLEYDRYQGRILVFVDRGLQVIDERTGAPLRWTPLPDATRRFILALTPSGLLFVTPLYVDPHRVEVFDAHSGVLVRVIPGVSTQPIAFGDPRSGRRFAISCQSSSCDDWPRILDAATGQDVGEASTVPAGFPGGVYSSVDYPRHLPVAGHDIRYDPGATPASGCIYNGGCEPGPGTITFVDQRTHRVLKAFRPGVGLGDFALDVHASRIFVASANSGEGHLYMLDARTGALLGSPVTWDAGHTATALSASSLVGAGLGLDARDGYLVAVEHSTVHVLDPATGVEIRSVDLDADLGMVQVVSPGIAVIAGSTGPSYDLATRGYLYVVDLRSGKVLRKVQTDVTFDWLVGDRTGRLFVWDGAARSGTSIQDSLYSLQIVPAG